MVDKYILSHIIPLIHAPVMIYDEEGRYETALESVEDDRIIDSERFVGKADSEMPYLYVDEDGVAFCAMMSLVDKKYIVFGEVCIYKAIERNDVHIPFCERDVYISSACIAWKIITGKEISKTDVLFKNVLLETPLEEFMTKEIFRYHEEGRTHNPYAQELREHDSIRRGDLDTLKANIDEVYSGEVGTVASDQLRNIKNIAVYVIGSAARCAIEGGLQPEMAFAMSDTYIKYIEEELDDPLKVERVAREAEFDYAREVNSLNKHGSLNPLMLQVKDYVFRHMHENVRVRDIAKSIGVSPNYLSEQFSQSEGITLKQYILDEKIKSSEYLLKYTDYSLQEISSFYAFSSQSRFSAYFQRRNGITPAKYRKMYRKCKNE